MRLWLRVAVLVCATACVVNVDYGGGPYRCIEQPVCAEGFVCVDGQCVVPQGIDAGNPDAASPLAPVVPSFQAPTLLADLSDLGSNDDDASFSADLLYVIFSSNRGGVGSDLYQSSRATAADLWPTPTLLTELNSPEDESTVALTSNGLGVLFGSERQGGFGMLDLYLSTRTSRAAPWSAPAHIVELSTPSNDGAGWISDDLASVIIHSARGGADSDLYTATREGGTFAAPVAIAEVNTPSNDDSGRYAADGLVLTLHSIRDGNNDLFAATRASIDDEFGPAAPIRGLTTAALEQDAWLSDDLCTIFFARRESMMIRNLYMARCDL